MSFLTAEKKDHVARCPVRWGGKTYMGNARLKTFFSFGRLPLVPSNANPDQIDHFFVFSIFLGRDSDTPRRELFFLGRGVGVVNEPK